MLRLTDIRSIADTRFWMPIAAAAAVVDTAGLFVWRYTSPPGAPINKWYDRFGLAAYGADVLSMIIGVVLTQLVTARLGGPWSPLTFCAVAVAIQMVHDIFFAAVVVPSVPKGRNSIMDLMMEYTHISWPQGVLVVDAIYMILTSLIAMALASLDPSISWMMLLVTLYTTMYVLFTRPT